MNRYHTFPQLGSCGQLGNQLFQIAATIGAASDQEADVYFRPDWEYRDRFSLPPHMFKSPPPGASVVEHSGYLQEFWRFFRWRHEIRKYLQPSRSVQVKLQERRDEYYGRSMGLNHVSIHVRRGDFLNYPDVFHSLDIDYYLKALEAIRSHREVTTAMLFSDDLPAAVELLKDRLPIDIVPVEIRPGDTPDLHMHLMGCSWSIITANSTFSWWAAFIAEATHRLTVMPSRWGPDGSEYQGRARTLKIPYWIQI